MFDNGILPVDTPENKNVPLPLLVANQWGFELTYHVDEQGQYWYLILDWIKGLITSEAEHASNAWTDLKRRGTVKTQDGIQSLPYRAKDNKVYQREFATDKLLYIIAQNLRSRQDRPQLKLIKEFLAKAGVFVDEVRRDPDTLVNALVIDDPDKVLDAVVENYRRQGKTDEWIGARLAGIVARNQFTRALQVAIQETLDRRDYGTATNQIYLGLWERTADQLKQQIGLSKRQNLRDHQPGVALSYQMIAEQVSAHQLGNRQELSLREGLGIIREVAEVIGQQAAQTAKLMGMDLATGKKMLT